MNKRKLSVSELKKVVEDSICNSVLSEEIYIDELAWNTEYNTYCQTDYMDEEYSIPKLFSIIDMKRNHLYRLGQIFCKSGEYFLFLDNSGNVNIEEDHLSQHQDIHKYVVNGMSLEDTFSFVQL